METVIFTLLLCGLAGASLAFSYKNSQKISELEDKQEKARKDINALYIKPLVKPKKKTPIKKATAKKSSYQRKSATKKQILKG